MNIKKTFNNRARALISVVAVSTLALGGVAMGDLGTQTAEASDNKIMSGHLCIPEEGADDTDLVSLKFLQSEANQWYKCPVIRDDTTGELDFVRIRVENRTSSPVRPRCRVAAVSPLGGAMDVSPFKSSTSSEDTDTLKFNLNNFTEYDHGHYVIECRLGNQDRIFSYRTNED